MRDDLRLAVRGLRRAPLFGVTAIVTMALGIGANTAIFSFVNALLLGPLPYADAERLIRIDAVRGKERGKLMPREWEELNRDQSTFEGVAGWYPSQYNSSAGGPPEVLRAAMTTANLFRVLGVGLMHGETWREGTHRERNPAVVLSQEVWKRRFGGDAGIVGRTITLDFANYQVVGIAAAGFDFPGKTELFRAAHLGGAQNWDVRSLYVVARLRAGVSREEAQQRLNGFGTRMEQAYPRTNRGVRFEARPLRDAYVGEVRPYLTLTMGMVGLVLAIACANVVSLLLSRGVARRKELAVRAALGAGRGRILRQLTTEALTVGLFGGAAGLGLGWWWTGLIREWLRADLPLWMRAELDGRVLLFTLVTAMAAGVVAGLLPGLLFAGPDGSEALRESSRGSSGGRKSARLRQALVAGELGLAVTLLIAAGLLVKSFRQLQGADVGFARTPALTVRTDPPWGRYNKVEQTALFYRLAQEKLGAIPGVKAVAANHSLPLAVNQNYGKPAIVVEGQSIDEQQRNPFVNVQIVSPNYLEAMRIRLREGRSFSADDRLATTAVAVMSRPLAKRLFGDGQAVGKRVQLPGLLSALNESRTNWLEVVGVAEGVKSEDLLGEPSLDLYLSNQQQFAGDTFFVLRTAGKPMELAEAVRRAIQEVDADQPVFAIQALDELIDDTVWQRRMAGKLSLWFGGLALVLSAVGAYGVLSYLVTLRTREIGIRQALGLTPWRAGWLVLREGMALAGVGLGVGILVALPVGRMMESVLYEVSGQDGMVYGSATGIVLLVALLASAVPAWRAGRVDPIVALRNE